jgi:hypothetical protein
MEQLFQSILILCIAFAVLYSIIRDPELRKLIGMGFIGGIVFYVLEYLQ